MILYLLIVYFMIISRICLDKDKIQVKKSVRNWNVQNGRCFLRQRYCVNLHILLHEVHDNNDGVLLVVFPF